ncbi:MAG: glycosyltransferase [Candidatus Dormibacteria bacterium]
MRLAIVTESFLPWVNGLRRAAPANVHLAGQLEGDALADVYAAADVFLHPAATETFGQVIQEAMASGLPVVGGRAGGAGWLVEEGRTGLLAEPPGEGLGEVLTTMLRRPDLAGMGMEGRRAVAGRSWAATFDALLDDYAALAGDRSRRAAA